MDPVRARFSATAAQVAARAEREIHPVREHVERLVVLRGDELGVPPGPEIARLLELVAEERAAGTIATRDEALELVRRHVKPL